MRWGETSRFPDVERIEAMTAGPRHTVEGHRVYDMLTSPHAIRVFMEHHVFAVWDFMSLLKSLQARLTCVDVPWRPVGSPATRRFVNELVLEEESDEIDDGQYLSHFELYVRGMHEFGANTRPIKSFVTALKAGHSVPEALLQAEAPPAARAFVATTWDIVEDGTTHELAAAFALGRENLIPVMFTNVRRLSADTGGLTTFVVYLERHIELDGEIHTPLAYRLLAEACGSDGSRWADAAAVARRSLDARCTLWDGVVDAIEVQNPSAVLLSAGET